MAYAMGDATSTVAIGKDASGYDWQTVGYWATLRSSQKLPSDDGMKFLRIGHPNPVLINIGKLGMRFIRTVTTPAKATKKTCTRRIRKKRKTTRNNEPGTRTYPRMLTAKLCWNSKKR